jgi:hypothetical protein
MWHCVDVVWTDVSEKRIASIFRVEKSTSEEWAWGGCCRLGSVCSRHMLRRRHSSQSVLLKSPHRKHSFLHQCVTSSHIKHRFLIIVCWIMFTELLPGNTLIKSVTIYNKKFWEELITCCHLTHIEYLIWHRSHRKHCIQQFFCCCGNIFTKPMPSNSCLFWLHYLAFKRQRGAHRQQGDTISLLLFFFKVG